MLPQPPPHAVITSKANVAVRTRTAPTTPQWGFMKLLAWVLARQTRAECGDDESGKTWNAVAWAARTPSGAASIPISRRRRNMESKRATRKLRNAASFIIGEVPWQKHKLMSAGTRCSYTYLYGHRGKHNLEFRAQRLASKG